MGSSGCSLSLAPLTPAVRGKKKQQMDSKGIIETKAVYIGLATFAALYIGFIILGNILSENNFALLFWLQIVLLVISGYVAGHIAGNNGWVNGLMVGIAAPVVLAVGLSIATLQLDMAGSIFSALGVMWLIQSVISCAIGGALSDLRAKYL